MSARAVGKVIKAEDWPHLFRPRSVWIMSGVLVKENRQVPFSKVKEDMELRDFKLHEFRGRFFVTRNDDDSVFYQYEGEDVDGR